MRQRLFMIGLIICLAYVALYMSKTLGMPVMPT